MSQVSVKRVKDKKALETAVEDAQAEGWKLSAQSNSTAVLKKPGSLGSIVGHVVVFFLTVWWTFFLGNILYAAYRYVSGSQELRIKIEN